MKIKTLLLSTLLGSSIHSHAKDTGFFGQMKDYLTSHYAELVGEVVKEQVQDQIVNRFGNKEQVVHHDPIEGLTKKIITMESSPMHFAVDYKQQAQHLNRLTETLKAERSAMSNGDGSSVGQEPLTCHSYRTPRNDSQWAFFPVWTGALKWDQTVTFEGNCFSEISMTMRKVNDTQFKILATSKDNRAGENEWCFDYLFFANTELYHFETLTFEGDHEWIFDIPSDLALSDIDNNGLENYLFCESLNDELLSLITTLKAFIGGLGLHGHIPLFNPKVPKYMEEANKEFLKWGINWDLEERTTRKVEIDESLIQSGDYLAVLRLDGLDPMIMYGTGSHSGHSVMALRFDGELYIVESQDAWYWPVQRIQRNRFSEWIKYAENCDFHVAHLPLSDEMRKKFNETAAIEYFNKQQGLPYGYHNFLYGWIDTPEDNWPRLLPKHLVPIAFSIIERMDKNTTDIFFSQSLNKKLNTTGLNISEIVYESSQRGITIHDVMAMVEQDGWKYEGQYHDGESMVCSAFVTAMWKAAGLFDVPINAVEWGPKDVYQVDFFNKDWAEQRPQACKDADPDAHFCQLLGKYRFKFPGFSSITPYAHMNDHCPSIAPDFVRPEGC